MKSARRAWRRFVGSFTGQRQEGELANEFAMHVDLLTEDNIRAGMDPRAARRAALLKFGGTEAIKENYRDQRGLPGLEGSLLDLKYAFRGLCKSPGFATVAVLTLAVGIGANTAIFSLMSQLLLRPAGIDDASRVVTVRTRHGKLNLDFFGASPVVLKDLQGSKQVFERAAVLDGNFGDVNYTGGGEPERLRGAGVSVEWFDVFGAKPMLGRVFTKEEDQPKQNRVVMLSHATWTRLFAADPRVIGRNMELNGTPHQIVGVMPERFRWPQEAELWVPAGLTPELFEPRNRFNTSVLAIARTRPGVSQQGANAWLGVLTDRVRNSNSKGSSYARESDWSISAVPFTDYAAGDNKIAVLLLVGAVGFVLLIACSNIAGMMVARTSARSREIAVRSALGAGRGRLVRQLLSESLLLAMAGGAAAIALALYAVRILIALAPEKVAAGLDGHLDARVLVFCAAAALLSGVLFALAPAWRLLRMKQPTGLASDGRSAAFGPMKQRLRSTLVVGETALALLLLVGAGLFLRSFSRLQKLNPGFDSRGVMTAFFTLPPLEKYKLAPGVIDFERTIVENLRADKQIRAVGIGHSLPLSGNNQAGNFEAEGHPIAPGGVAPHGDRRVITPGYLEALSVPLKQGRYFNDQDRLGTEPVVLIDDNLARQYWPGENPVGRHLRVGQTWHTIVGVVGHVIHANLAADSGKGAYYFAMYQRWWPIASIVVKTSGDSASASDAIRRAVRAADPNQAVHTFMPMEDYVSRDLAARRFGMRLLAFFAVLALFLAAIGLYGVISYSVTQRRAEMGVRLALGATPGDVLQLVLGNGMRLGVLGAAIGIAVALAGAKFIESQLFQISPFDPLTISATAALLLAVVVLATYLPARRAMRVDPATSLRPE